jgi:RimJ/RimL family protein N-acetyltransferase
MSPSFGSRTSDDEPERGKLEASTPQMGEGRGTEPSDDASRPTKFIVAGEVEDEAAMGGSAGGAAKPRAISARIGLREVTESDLPRFFEHQLDAEANRMAAFGAKDPTDREAFLTHWKRNLRTPEAVHRAVLVDGSVVGHIAQFELLGKPSISYWYSRNVWGKGVATAALRKFLRQVRIRPIYARVAKDNLASVRVLEKCGFQQRGQERAFAEGRGKVVEELIFRRDTR